MRKRRVIGFSLLVILSTFGLWRFWWSALDHNPQQDECTFGTVSNARYRELLAEAKRRQRLGQKAWIPLRGAPAQRADLIRYRIEDLTAGMTSLYERIAAAHAVMRAAGGHITDDGSTGYEKNGWELAILHGRNGIPNIGEIAHSLVYALYSHRIGDSSFFYPRSSVHLTLIGKSNVGERRHDLLRPSYEDEFQILVFDPWFPLTSIITKLPFPKDIAQQGLGCPGVPPAVYAETYDAWSAARRAERNKP
jgi:hypothetical protein